MKNNTLQWLLIMIDYLIYWFPSKSLPINYRFVHLITSYSSLSVISIVSLILQHQHYKYRTLLAIVAKLLHPLAVSIHDNVTATLLHVTGLKPILNIIASISVVILMAMNDEWHDLKEPFVSHAKSEYDSFVHPIRYTLIGFPSGNWMRLKFKWSLIFHLLFLYIIALSSRIRFEYKTDTNNYINYTS